MMNFLTQFYRFRYSTSHMFFPKIIITILVFLAVCLVVQRIVKCRREGCPFLPVRGRFFAAGFDRLKFAGTFALLVLYMSALKPLGFLAASLIFIFLFNVLFCGTLKAKSLAVSAVVTAVSCVAVWYTFGVLFRISLP